MIAEYLGTDAESIFLYWKGRVALYAILKAAGIGKGDEVILSGLTCVVVPNAIKYLGATPVYADVDCNTYNPPAKSYINKVTSLTKAIILQNTFGLSSELEEIVAFAIDKGLLTIEDCTHGFGGKYNNKPNGTHCDASIFSTQWNKPFSSGIGGFSYIENANLRSSVIEINKVLKRPSIFESSLLSVLVWFREHLMTDNNYWFLRGIYRRLSKKGLIIGSSQGSELSGTAMPANYCKGMSQVQVKKGIRSISKLRNDLLLRKANADTYSQFLKRHGKIYVNELLRDNHSFLVYPLLVSDRQYFMQEAEKHKISLGDWFLSPIHPVINNFSKWDLIENDVPNACFLSGHLVNLPTLERDLKPVLVFLEEYKNYIM